MMVQPRWLKFRNNSMRLLAFFNDTATTEIYTLSLHDALPILTQARGAGSRADSAVQTRRAEHIEEARRDALALDQAHRAGVAVRQDGFGRADCDFIQPLSSKCQRFIPAHRFEPALSLWTNATHRREQSIPMVSSFGIARHLRAKHALCGRMIGVAGHLDGAAVLHGDAHRTGVGAIVRTDSASEFGGSVHADILWECAKSGQIKRFYYG